jgi:hypothetical protein
MESTPYIYQDVVERVLGIATLTEAPKNEPACFICRREYGSAGPGIETHLDFLSLLPGAYRKTFVEQVVEAVQTPCGHILCLFCLSTWFKRRRVCSCPMCRKPIQIAFLFELENTDDGRVDVGVQGLSLALHIPTPLAKETYRIVNLQTRELLTTTAPMPFQWNAEAMIHDLPIVMITIARRFHYQSLRKEEGVPKDLSYMKRHNPVQLVTAQPRFNDLKSLARPDAPLAKHKDAFEMYQLMCDRIRDLEGTVGDGYSRCTNWEGLARALLYRIVQEKMPHAEGGVGQIRWRCYVWCVIKAVFVWQAYCERARRLMCLRRQQVSIDTAREDEGVRTYHIG